MERIKACYRLSEYPRRSCFAKTSSSNGRGLFCRVVALPCFFSEPGHCWPHWSLCGGQAEERSWGYYSTVSVNLPLPLFSSDSSLGIRPVGTARQLRGNYQWLCVNRHHAAATATLLDLIAIRAVAGYKAPQPGTGSAKLYNTCDSPAICWPWCHASYEAGPILCILPVA